MEAGETNSDSKESDLTNPTGSDATYSRERIKKEFNSIGDFEKHVIILIYNRVLI